VDSDSALTSSLAAAWSESDTETQDIIT